MFTMDKEARLVLDEGMITLSFENSSASSRLMDIILSGGYAYDGDVAVIVGGEHFVHNTGSRMITTVENDQDGILVGFGGGEVVELELNGTFIDRRHLRGFGAGSFFGMDCQAQQQAGKVEVNLFHGGTSYNLEISNGMPLYR
jgi:hypothetical protein